MENPYKILGVADNASLDECKKAMRKLARQHHPDFGGDAETFCKINKAYNDIISGDYARSIRVLPRQDIKRYACTFSSLFEVDVIQV